MATKKTTAPEDDVLQKAATAIDSTPETVEVKTAPAKPSTKIGKLISKDKTRVPRKLKKKRQKAAAKNS